MEKMEDWWGNLEKLEKLDDELSERLFGNYNLLKMKMVFNVQSFLEAFGLIMILKSFSFAKVLEWRNLTKKNGKN